jgi:hypothetical protein
MRHAIAIRPCVPWGILGLVLGGPAMLKALILLILFWLVFSLTPLWAGSVTATWEASQGADGYQVHYGLASGNYTASVDTGAATSAMIAGLDTGETYFFVAVAYNTAGVSPYSNEVSTTITEPPPLDTTPPTVSITSPVNGARVSHKNTIMLQATASDDSGVVRHVTFTVIQSSVVTYTCVAPAVPYSCPWEVPAAPGRTYAIAALATDAAGNTAASRPVQVTS